jgi:hypothetical protein
MRLITTYFDYPGNKVFGQLLKLMDSSFKKQGLKLEKVKMAIPEGGRNNRQIDSNHEKLKVWAGLLEESAENVVFFDTDMYCQKDFRYGMGKVQHIGLTYRRPGQGFPINGGVVFVRNTPESKAFFREWIAADKWLYENPDDHAVWQEKYAGINQSSLGYILEEKGMAQYVTKLPCDEFNCVEPWASWRTACLIHIKSRLRRGWQGITMGQTLSVKACAKMLRSESRNIGIVPQSPQMAIQLAEEPRRVH